MAVYSPNPLASFRPQAAAPMPGTKKLRQSAFQTLLGEARAKRAAAAAMAEKGCSFRATMAVVEAAYALANAISLSQHYHGKNRLPALLKGILPDVLEYSSRETFNTPEMYELSQMYFDLAGFSAMASAASRQKSRLLAEMRSDKDMAALVDIERLARKLAEQRYDGCGYPGEAVTITHILEQLQALSPMNRKGYSGFLNPILAGIQGHYAGTTVAAHIEAALESFEKKA